MTYDQETLDFIYDRSTGYCHICGKKLCRTNYARPGARGAWEVEHSNPQANGGSSRLTNLYAAHISCNRSKGKASTKSARRSYGRSRAPLSRTKRAEARTENGLGGALIGGLLGSAFGPIGALVGATIVGKLAYDENPDH